MIELIMKVDYCVIALGYLLLAILHLMEHGHHESHSPEMEVTAPFVTAIEEIGKS